MRIKTESHPLENITLQAFADREHHDGVSLGYFMAEASRSRSGIRATRVFVKQAQDVLGYMERQGRLYRDEYGWYRRAEAPAIVFAEPLYIRPPRARKPKPTNAVPFPRKSNITSIHFHPPHMPLLHTK